MRQTKLTCFLECVWLSNQKPKKMITDKNSEFLVTVEDTYKRNGASSYDKRLVDNFDDMDLKEELLRGIYAYGFEKPSAIQQQTILPIITSKPPSDLIAQAQAGTGKTAGFIIPMLQRLNIEVNQVQGLVLCPTRELSIATKRVIEVVGEFLGVKVLALVGGVAVHNDIKTLQESVVHVVVGTPGRVLHHIRSGHLDIYHLKMLIMDEADEISSRGFNEQICDIFKKIPQDTQVCLFSSTMPNEVLEITDKFMRNPIKIVVKRKELTLESIKQYYINVEKEEWKLDTLLDFFSVIPVAQCVIYCNTRRKVEYLTDELKKRDFMASSLHVEMNRDNFDLVFQDFKKGAYRILITTDIALKTSTDFNFVNFVINYDFPRRKESYLHRIGRSGHYGYRLVAINFVTKDDVGVLREIENYYCTSIEECPEYIVNFI